MSLAARWRLWRSLKGWNTDRKHAPSQCRKTCKIWSYMNWALQLTPHSSPWFTKIWSAKVWQCHETVNFITIKYLTLGSRSNPVRPKPNLSSSSSFPFCSLRLSEDPVISHRRRHCRWVRLHLQMSKTMSRPSWSSVVAWIIRRMNTCKQEIDTNWTKDKKLKHNSSL